MAKTLICHTASESVLGTEFAVGQEYPIHEETDGDYMVVSDKQPFPTTRVVGFAKEPNRNGLSYKDYFTLKEA